MWDGGSAGGCSRSRSGPACRSRWRAWSTSRSRPASPGCPQRPGADADPLRVLVFDMGGGTLDIAVLDVRGAPPDVSVLAAVGVAEAGDALDDAIAEDLDYALARPASTSIAWPTRSGPGAAGRRRPGGEDRAVHRRRRPCRLPPDVRRRRDPVHAGNSSTRSSSPAGPGRAVRRRGAAGRAADRAGAGSAYDIARTADRDAGRGRRRGRPLRRHEPDPLCRATVAVRSSDRRPGSSWPRPAGERGRDRAGARRRYGRINMYRPAFDVLRRVGPRAASPARLRGVHAAGRVVADRPGRQRSALRPQWT